MKTRKRILSIVLTIAILLLLVLDIPVTAAGTKKVDVLFTHDTHSHLDSFSTIVDGQQKEVGGFAKIKTLMDEKKKDNPCLLYTSSSIMRCGIMNCVPILPPRWEIWEVKKKSMDRER